jgi:hypothetical protein
MTETYCKVKNSINIFNLYRNCVAGAYNKQFAHNMTLKYNFILQIYCNVVSLHLFCRKVAGSNPDEVDFFNLPNPSSRTVVMVSTQPLTEMSTRSLPGGKTRPVGRADNLTAIFEPIV